MRVKTLMVARRESYETDAGQLVGTVSLEGSNGAMEVRISNQGLSKIMEVIRGEIGYTAKQNAKQVDRAMSGASNEPVLLANLEVGDGQED